MTGSPADFADRASRAEVRSLSYHPDQGWSGPFPDLDSANTLLTVFAANAFWENRAPLDELRQAFPDSVILGCGASETAYNGQLRSDYISVGIIKFVSTEIKFAAADLIDMDNSRAAGKLLAEQLVDPNLKGVMLFSKGLEVEATELVRGMQHVLPPGVPIAGGLASNRQLEECWVNANGDLRNDAVCAVGLVGDKVELVCTNGGGWVPTSERHMVTRVDRKRILEIDGRRAYDVFAEESTSGTVDEDPWARDLATQSIALKFDGADVVRSILGSDKEHGYIDVAGDIEEGCQIQFMETSVDDLLDGVDEAAHGLRMKTVGLTEKSLCVIIGCMGRLSILGEQSTQEMQRLHAAIGDNICQVGMYSLGEILTTSSSYPQVHNLTMNVAVIREH